MGKYIIRRLVMGIITVMMLIIITFFLTRMIPGSPFQNGTVSEQILDSAETQYGLNEPVLVQFKVYVGNLWHGDLGISFKKPGVTVNEVIKRALPITFAIGIPAFFFALVGGTICGIIQATAKKRCTKEILLTCTAIFSGIPNFVTALLLSLVFGVWLRWFPIAGLGSLSHYVLPVLSLSLYPASVIAKLEYAAYSEAMKQDYVLLAKAKGLGGYTIMWKHILKNAIIPVVAYMGPMAAYLLTGSFVVESIFTIPGLGREFVNSIANRDYTLIMGLTIFMGVMVIVAGLGSDIICKAMNPIPEHTK